ncbi:flavin-containing monooxygenase [Sorangium sp. So ce1078]|uniref:flavin-containing monooxygenase n=1 Tax=Sorangium sp. So ce1078 TaxID=3133329 RepID=UPI003F5FBEFD
MTPPFTARPRRRVEVVVVGGGQSGLALGYHLAGQGRSFVLLDAAERIGHAWRSRWDSLRLITPCPYNDLPGMRFPAPAWSFPHKDEVAAYLARYAETFALPVRLGERVRAVRQDGAGYLVEAATALYEAPVVVVATGAFQHPHVPALPGDVDPSLFQLHSAAYRSPAQIPEGDVLVVGCGNSGAGIALELAASRRVCLSLGRTASSPRRILGRDLFFWAHALGLTRVTAESRLGKRLRRGPDGLIGIDPRSIARRGVALAPRLVQLDGRTARFADGSRRRVDAVLWATGFRPRFDFLDVPVLDGRGAPVHRRGVTRAPGLYFLGLPWQHRIDSSLLGGVGRDAQHLAEQIQRHLAGASAAATARQEEPIHVR